jgi:hypothetical protein
LVFHEIGWDLDVPNVSFDESGSSGTFDRVGAESRDESRKSDGKDEVVGERRVDFETLEDAQRSTS